MENKWFEPIRERPKAIEIEDAKTHNKIKLQIKPTLNLLRFRQARGHLYITYENYLRLCKGYQQIMRIEKTLEDTPDYKPPTRTEMNEWVDKMFEVFKQERPLRR